MNIIKTALNKIQNQEATFIIIKNNTIIYQDSGIGVSPIRKLINTNPDILKDAIIVDKIIGKAAAMLLIPYNILQIHTLLLSEPALELLNKYNIKNSYLSITPIIKNRTNTAMCPLEECVKDIDDLAKAKENIEKTIQELMKKK